MKTVIFVLIILILIAGCTKHIEETKQSVNEEVQPATVQQETGEQSNEENGAGMLPESNISSSITNAPVQQEDTNPKANPKESSSTSPLISSPIDVLNDGLVKKWGADCKSKNSDLEKAKCIIDWQEKNIFWCYTHPEETVMPKMFETGYPDCVADMQLQQMKPNSFPVSKIFELKFRNNKLFGACYTYATTYCAFARWNGLTCRVMEVKIITPQTYSASQGDYGIGYCGAAQKSYLDKLGLNCEEWKKLDWTIDYDHYWAEVLIDGKWKIMEKPTWAYMRDTQKHIIDAGRDYEDTEW